MNLGNFLQTDGETKGVSHGFEKIRNCHYCILIFIDCRIKSGNDRSYLLDGSGNDRSYFLDDPDMMS